MPLLARRPNIRNSFDPLVGRPSFSNFDNFNFLEIAAMALERVLGEVGILVRLHECYPHDPPAVGAQRALSGFWRIKIVRLRHHFPEDLTELSSSRS